MAELRMIKRIERPGRQHYVEIAQRPDGLFQWIAHSQVTEDGCTFWAPVDGYSGLFDSAEAAEREAQTALPWLKLTI